MKTTNLLTISMVAVVFAGCAHSNVNPPLAGRAEQYAPGWINYADGDLTQHMVAGPAVVVRDENNIVHVSVPVRCDTNYTLRIDYRYTFFDPNHQTMSQSTWLQKTLYPNIPDRIEFNSVSPMVDRYQIDLRYSR